MDEIKNIVLYDPDKTACLDEKEIEECLDRVKPIFKEEKNINKNTWKSSICG